MAIAYGASELCVASARILTSRIRMPDGMRQGKVAMSCIQRCVTKVVVVVENIATFEPPFLSSKGFMSGIYKAFLYIFCSWCILVEKMFR